MSELTRVKINAPLVVHETIDGEVVIVNFGNGTYYSLVDTGGVIWQSIEDGLGIQEIADELQGRYDAERSEIERAVRQLIGEMIREEIVLPAAADGPEQLNRSATTASSHQPNERAEFALPVLQKYTDMEGLLLIDPIHEVDDSGWPNRRADPLGAG